MAFPVSSCARRLEMSRHGSVSMPPLNIPNSAMRSAFRTIGVISGIKIELGK
ncbi:MAG: hypothetical protein WDA41_09070 [Candidatus Neomarinimicrobiota bacterium]|nr:hypothetical protein [Candidatus Neomarinimicrobiota bacterium]